MNAPSVLVRLRAAGLAVSADGAALVIRGRVPNDLKTLARANKLQVMADLAEEAAEACLHCPRCGTLDYEPLGAGRRRCFPCGQAWG